MSRDDIILLENFAHDFEHTEHVIFHRGDREPGTEFSKEARVKIAAAIKRAIYATTVEEG